MTISFSVTMAEDTYEEVRELMAKTGKNRNEIISEAVSIVYENVVKKKLIGNKGCTSKFKVENC